MNSGRHKPVPGLHFIATPIGAARDITLRALDLLAEADAIAAEDTRTLRHLMEIHGVALRDRPLISYHDHNGTQARPKIIGWLSEGKSVVYASEAGTPLVADPGYQLGRSAIEEGYPVYSAPGPSAVLAALTVSGLPSDRFLFAGFPPTSQKARQGWLSELAGVQATVILYESPNRLHDLLSDLQLTFGPQRPAVICRELTKKFEEVTRGSVEEVAAAYAERAVKGEIVVVLGRAGKQETSASDLADALRDAMKTLSVKDAAAMVAEMTGLPRREVYQAALALTRD